MLIFCFNFAMFTFT